MTYDQIIGRLRVMRQKEMQRGFPSKTQQARLDELGELINDLQNFQDRATNGMNMVSYSQEEVKDVLVGYFGDELILAHPNREAVKVKEVEGISTLHSDKSSHEAIYSIIKLRRAA